MREVLRREEIILSKAHTIKQLLLVTSAPCEVEVDWSKECVRVLRGPMCIGELSFDSLLNSRVGNSFIANYIISCLKR